MQITDDLPPGPTLPAAIQLYKLFSKPLPFFMDCYQKYGRAFTLKLPGGKTFVVISEPDAIREIFQASSGQTLTGKPNSDVLKTTLGHHSLLTLDGDKHLQHRKILSFPFHGDRMQAYADIMLQETNKMIQQLEPGTTVPLLPYMHNVTLGVILRAIFGVEDENKFVELESKLAKLLGFIKSKAGLMTMLIPGLQIDLGRLSPWGKLQRILREVNSALYAEINHRKQVVHLAQHDDVLSLLLQATYEDGSRLTDQELRDEMLTMLNAGHETTATSLAWAMYRIHANPTVLEKILQELKAVVGTGEVSREHIPKLVYLEAVAKETLRLLPIISFVVRELQQPMQIDGYRLPAGITVVPCIHLAHHRAEHWPEPERFNPERFIDTKISPYNFLPFGGGIRRCLGASMALYEMKAVLAQMLSKVSFALPPNYVPEPTRHGIVLGPSEAMPLHIIGVKNHVS